MSEEPTSTTDPVDPAVACLAVELISPYRYARSSPAARELQAAVLATADAPEGLSVLNIDPVSVWGEPSEVVSHVARLDHPVGQVAREILAAAGGGELPPGVDPHLVAARTDLTYHPHHLAWVLATGDDEVLETVIGAGGPAAATAFAAASVQACTAPWLLRSLPCPGEYRRRYYAAVGSLHDEIAAHMRALLEKLISTPGSLAALLDATAPDPLVADAVRGWSLRGTIGDVFGAAALRGTGVELAALVAANQRRLNDADRAAYGKWAVATSVPLDVGLLTEIGPGAESQLSIWDRSEREDARELRDTQLRNLVLALELCGPRPEVVARLNSEDLRSVLSSAELERYVLNPEPAWVRPTDDLPRRVVLAYAAHGDSESLRGLWALVGHCGARRFGTTRHETELGAALAKNELVPVDGAADFRQVWEAFAALHVEPAPPPDTSELVAAAAATLARPHSPQDVNRAVMHLRDDPRLAGMLGAALRGATKVLVTEAIAEALLELTSGSTWELDPAHPAADQLLNMPVRLYRHRSPVAGLKPWSAHVGAVVMSHLGERPDRWLEFAAAVEHAEASACVAECVAAATAAHP